MEPADCRWWPAGGRLRPGTLPATHLVCPPSPQIAKQSLRPFCTVCNRYFRTPRKFVEHVKSQEHKDKAKEVTPAPSGGIDSERCRVLAKATQQVEIDPSPNSEQVQGAWDSRGCGVDGVWRLGHPELT